MKCPLCDSVDNIIVRGTPLLELKNRWISAFGFDPFPSNFTSAFMNKLKCLNCQLQHFDPPIYGDGQFYARLSKYPWYYESNKWEFDAAASIVGRLAPTNLLEIGSGDGLFLDKIRGLQINSEGIDINPDAVAKCKQKGLKVRLQNVFEIAETFDAVVSFQVLEHMENLKSLMEFLVTKLVRPGGYLILAVPNPDGYLRELGVNLLDMPPHHNSCWGLPTFEFLAAHYGLTLMEYVQEPLRYVHYLSLVDCVKQSQTESANLSLRTRIFNRVQGLIVRMLAPLAYLRDRDHIIGQTHMVVFQNKNQKLIRE
jgi:SAM-dependent methyltransferase